jgi:conjugal transfer pilus assembly protein TraU
MYLIFAILLILLENLPAGATCCKVPIEAEEVAWEQMLITEWQGECTCGAGPYRRHGTLVTFWEPVAIIETVKDPYCMMATGEDQTEGLEQPFLPGVKAGTHSDTGAQEDHSVFVQLHISFPEYLDLSIAENDSRCHESSRVNPLDYASEDDPAWNDDTVAAAEYPETALSATEEMQSACRADAISSQAELPIDALFWCMGAWGSTYPMSGHVNNDEYVTGNISAAARAIYIAGRTARIMDTASYYCAASPMPLWIKSYFKLQPIRPARRDFLIPIGLSPMVWSSGLNDWNQPCMDNFAWVLWRKRWCCQ